MSHSSGLGSEVEVTYDVRCDAIEYETIAGGCDECERERDMWNNESEREGGGDRSKY